MRLTGILVLLAALAAAPMASALGEVVVEAPDVRVHVDGATVPVPKTELIPFQVDGDVEVKDVDVSVSETRCALSTDVHLKKHEQAADACEAGHVSTGT